MSPSFSHALPHVLGYKSAQLTSAVNKPDSSGAMYSELECGICYLTYNAGRRCPRELQCKHSFCESCLLAMSRPVGTDEACKGADRSILCPLCRHATPISGERKIRAELRVDECVLERLLAAGVLEQEGDEPDGSEGEEGGHAQECCGDTEEATLPVTPADESVSLAGHRGGRVRLCLRKVWRKIGGKSSRQRGGQNCLAGDDLRNFAMMACYMF